MEPSIDIKNSEEKLEHMLEEVINRDTTFMDFVGSIDDYGLGIIREYKPKQEQKEEVMDDYDMIGFYKMKTHTQSYKVQLHPKYNVYDHLKERRAFLFC